MLGKRPYQFIWLIISFSGLIISGYNYKSNEDLINNRAKKKYPIIERYCNRTFNRSSKIWVMTELGKKRIEISEYNVCSKIQDSIELFYNDDFKYFFVPESMIIYKRYIFGFAISAILSILPYNKMKSNFTK